MVNPRICEAVPVAGLGGVSKNSVKPKVVSRYKIVPVAKHIGAYGGVKLGEVGGGVSL